MRILVLLNALVLATPIHAFAEWTVKPFVGVTFGSSHGFVDLDATADRVKPMFGGSFGWFWSDRLGIEMELAASPTFLKGSSGLVESGPAPRESGSEMRSTRSAGPPSSRREISLLA